MRAILAGIAGTFVAVIGIIIFFLVGQTDQQALDAAAPPPDVLAERAAPASRADPMTPVTVEEAERRSELHERLAVPEAERLAAVMAPSVITEVRDGKPDDPLSVELFGDLGLSNTPEAERAEPEPEPEPVLEPEPVEAEPEPEPEPEQPRWNVGDFRDRYRVGTERPGRAYGVRNFELPVDAALDGRGDGAWLLGPSLPGSPLATDEADRAALRVALGLDRWEATSLWGRNDDRFGEPILVADGYGNQDYSLTDPVVRPQFDWPAVEGYGAPQMDERSAARPAMIGTDANGMPYTTNDGPNPYLAAQSGAVVLARNGDLLFAQLVYGFNSDDVRGLPIYATITDYLPNGTIGPLNGARVHGQVAYSSHNAAIIFDTLVLQNGREFPISAIAVSNDGGTGIADRVNRHTLARYGSLFLAGIIQGVGEVAQIRLAPPDNSGGTVIINDGDGTVNVNGNDDEPTDKEIIAGALAPVGRNLTTVASAGFNRPPTISAPAGMPFAIVFLSTVVSDPAEGRTAFNPRTGRTEVVGSPTPTEAAPSPIPATGAVATGGTGGAVTIPETGETFVPAAGAEPGAVWNSLSGN
ncbi:MAG: DotG/IcmE/VirB10 family protein [Burkholderiaceae bacterium]|jgi:hypothetical protein|nr:DotG/IcmE/VirB10 family protein [Burkholderiaceae bacterium]